MDTQDLDLLDANAAAKLLGVPRSTLDFWLRTGSVDIPHLRLGARTVRFDRGDLVAFVRARREAARAALLERGARNGR